MQIQEIYDVDIYIDDLNIFEASGVVFMGANIYESISNPIPVCNLDLTIPLAWMDERTITDGTVIKFIVKCKDLNISEQYVFRLFNIIEMEVLQKFMKLRLEGVIDFYNGYTSGNSYNMHTTTSAIFKSIADANSLIPNIDMTNDKQLWIAGEKNLYQFMCNICAHSYVDETSCMFWAIDRYKNLLFKNLTTLFRTRQNEIFTFKQMTKPDFKNKLFAYSKAKGSIQSGTNNLKNDGYGGEDFAFNLSTYSFDTITAKKVVAESKMINISKDLSKGLSESWYAFNVGNFHENYFKAHKQNKRILSTYSTYVTLNCQFFQPYRLAQIVQYEYLDSQDENNKLFALSGVYMIDAIHIEISPNAITSDVELVMQGMNSKPITQVIF